MTCIIPLNCLLSARGDVKLLKTERMADKNPNKQPMIVKITKMKMNTF